MGHRGRGCGAARAGGSTVTLDGTPLTYGKTGTAADFDFANPNFISWGGRKRVLELA